MAKRHRISIDPTELVALAEKMNPSEASDFLQGFIEGALGQYIITETEAQEAGYRIGLEEFHREQRGRQIAARVGKARNEGGKKKKGEN